MSRSYKKVSNRGSSYGVSLKSEKKSEYKQFRLKSNDSLNKIDLEGDVVFPSIKQYVQYFWKGRGGNMYKYEDGYEESFRK